MMDQADLKLRWKFGRSAFALTRKEWLRLIRLKDTNNQYIVQFYEGPYVPVEPSELPAFLRS